MAYSLLALGDSYTIGEGLSPEESFPYQAVHLLQEAGLLFRPPDILARTGWTTDELAAAMSQWQLQPSYDFGTLLIGVNKQYRGGDVLEYAGQFESLLREAKRLSGGVIVLSIPDWSVSPFAQDHLKDTKGRTLSNVGVAAVIDVFNATAARIARQYHVTVIDITTPGRAAGAVPALYAADGLQPAAGAYRFWAEELAGAILHQLAADPQ